MNFIGTSLKLNGLSGDQAPPISAPLRFFLTAPLFGVIAGVLMLFSNTQILRDRYSINAIIITLAYIMLGGGFMLMILSLINALRGVSNFTATVKGISASLIFAFFIISMLILEYNILAPAFILPTYIKLKYTSKSERGEM